MYQGNWSCSTCGGAITELPFQPRSEAGLTCRTCYAKSKGNDAPPTPTGVQTSGPMPSEDVPDFDESQLVTEPPSAEDAFAGLEATAPAPAGEKPKFEGDWHCATCSNPITSLPFQPRRTDNLKCLDCFKASKG